MTETPKVLAQLNPSATTLTNAYTVPAATSVVVSSIFVCNSSASPTTFRISVARAGAIDAPAQYLFFDVPISGNDTFAATSGFTLATTDIIRVYAGSTTLSFNVFGVEVT